MSSTAATTPQDQDQNENNMEWSEARLDQERGKVAERVIRNKRLGKQVEVMDYNAQQGHHHMMLGAAHAELDQLNRNDAHYMVKHEKLMGTVTKHRRELAELDRNSAVAVGATEESKDKELADARQAGMDQERKEGAVLNNNNMKEAWRKMKWALAGAACCSFIYGYLFAATQPESKTLCCCLYGAVAAGIQLGFSCFLAYCFQIPSWIRKPKFA